jgi:hypothetical protein
MALESRDKQVEERILGGVIEALASVGRKPATDLAERASASVASRSCRPRAGPGQPARPRGPPADVVRVDRPPRPVIHRL